MNRLITLVAVASSGCATLGANALTVPMRVPVVGAPCEVHRDFAWRTEDGLTLRGWVFDPPGTPSGLVVFLHGKDINRQHFVGHVERFTKRGFQVLAYDQRAHGASQGERTTFGVREIDDLKRAIDRLGATRVILIGESLGAAVALQAAAVEPRVIGVVAGASFSELSRIVDEHRPVFFSRAAFGDAVQLAESHLGTRIDTIAPEAAIARIAAPVLLLHGKQDTFIHPRHAIRLHAAAPKSRLVWLDGVGHVLVWDKAWTAIETWLDDNQIT